MSTADEKDTEHPIVEATAQAEQPIAAPANEATASAQDDAAKAAEAHRLAEEHREFTRISNSIDVDVTSDGKVLSGHTRDVSLKGAFVRVGAELPPNTPCTLVLYLDSRESEARVEANGRVVRSIGDGMAIEIKELIGVDSYWHLRNLVTYNAEDVERVEEEFAMHRGLRRVDE